MACLSRISLIFIMIVTPLPSNGEKCKTSLFLGAILDQTSRAGKEAKVAMDMAIDEFCTRYGAKCHDNLLVNNSWEDRPVETASLTRTMIKDHQARAIFIGLKSWSNTIVASEICNKYQIPLISLANNNHIPNWAYQNFPFLIKAARNQQAEMKANAAIIRTWQWQKVNVIYEDVDSAKSDIFPYLVEAIQKVGSQISTLFPIPPYSPLNRNTTKKLKSLKDQQSRVYVVHTESIDLAKQIFKEAKRLGMMEEGSVWIATTSITNQIDSIDMPMISSMQGFLGLKSYIRKSGKHYNNIRTKFRSRYHSEFPHERNLEPGIFSLHAYDAAWSVALASASSGISEKELLGKILQTNFTGVSGPFRFNSSMLTPPHNIFQIVNVVGKSYNELGFWKEKFGFSKRIHKDRKQYNESMRVLGQVYWPGAPWTVPRGWAVPRSDRPLRIAVPASTTFSEFVNWKRDAKGNMVVGGFSIEVFKKVVELLPYHLPYKFISFKGPSYDSMVQQVQLEVFDAVVADTAVISKRCNYVEFSQRYSESGLQMVIYSNQRRIPRPWLFIKPFTARMWLITVVFNISNGLLIMWIEREENPDFKKGSIWSQMGSMLTSAFKTLFLLNGPNLSRNSTRLAFIVWSFMCLILTQSFTASLTTLLTVPELKQNTYDVEYLRKTGAKVGCDANSFVVKYLEDALRFDPQNIVKIYSGDEYAQSLQTGRIKAAFLEVPYVKLFLAKHCKNFTTSGQPLNIGGFGFAFAKSSPYLADISQAILNATESGTLLKLEESMLSSNNCSAKASTNDNGSFDTHLDIDSFWGLFLITAICSVFALLRHITHPRTQSEENKGEDRNQTADNDHVGDNQQSNDDQQDHIVIQVDNDQQLEGG